MIDFNIYNKSLIDGMKNGLKPFFEFINKNKSQTNNPYIFVEFQQIHNRLYSVQTEIVSILNNLNSIKTFNNNTEKTSVKTVINELNKLNQQIDLKSNIIVEFNKKHSKVNYNSNKVLPKTNESNKLIRPMIDNNTNNNIVTKINSDKNVNSIPLAKQLKSNNIANIIVNLKPINDSITNLIDVLKQNQSSTLELIDDVLDTKQYESKIAKPIGDIETKSILKETITSTQSESGSLLSSIFGKTGKFGIPMLSNLVNNKLVTSGMKIGGGLLLVDYLNKNPESIKYVGEFVSNTIKGVTKLTGRLLGEDLPKTASTISNILYEIPKAAYDGLSSAIKDDFEKGNFKKVAIELTAIGLTATLFFRKISKLFNKLSSAIPSIKTMPTLDLPETAGKNKLFNKNIAIAGVGLATGIGLDYLSENFKDSSESFSNQLSMASTGLNTFATTFSVTGNPLISAIAGLTGSIIDAGNSLKELYNESSNLAESQKDWFIQNNQLFGLTKQQASQLKSSLDESTFFTKTVTDASGLVNDYLLNLKQMKEAKTTQQENLYRNKLDILISEMKTNRGLFGGGQEAIEALKKIGALKENKSGDIYSPDIVAKNKNSFKELVKDISKNQSEDFNKSITKPFTDSIKKTTENIFNKNNQSKFDFPALPFTAKPFADGGKVADGLHTVGESGLELYYKKGNTTKVFNKPSPELNSIINDNINNDIKKSFNDFNSIVKDTVNGAIIKFSDLAKSNKQNNNMTQSPVNIINNNNNNFMNSNRGNNNFAYDTAQFAPKFV